MSIRGTRVVAYKSIKWAVAQVKSRAALFGASLLTLAMVGGLISPLASAAPPPTPDPNISEFSDGITSGAAPFGVTAGPDGNVWFTENSAAGSTNKIGKITPSGTVTEYNITTANAGARGITAGPDGNIWFTEGNRSKIGKITTAGVETDYSIPTLGSSPRGITAGPDGNVWFVENNSGKIGKVTPSGTFTEYSDPGLDCPWGITLGGDGNLWFSDQCNDQVGKITPSGTITLYPVADGTTRPITTGPDGNVWFGENGGGQNLGKVTPNGTVTEYASPFTIQGVTSGPDGHIWVTDNDQEIADATLDGTFTEHFPPTTFTEPYGITTGPDGNIWFAEYDNSSIGKYTFAMSSVENAAPNGGDANNDGVADSTQPNVTSVVDPVSGKYATLATSGCSSNASTSVAAESGNAVSDGSYNYPDGMMSFTLNCAIGATATVHMYYYGLTDNSNLVLRKYDATTKKYTTVSGAVFASKTIGGQHVTEVTYTIKDGGPLDQDGTANGVIVDPAGPAQSTVSAPDTGYGSPQSCLTLIIVSTLTAVTMMGAFTLHTRVLNKRDR